MLNTTERHSPHHHRLQAKAHASRHCRAQFRGRRITEQQPPEQHCSADNSPYVKACRIKLHTCCTPAALGRTCQKQHTAANQSKLVNRSTPRLLPSHTQHTPRSEQSSWQRTTLPGLSYNSCNTCFTTPLSPLHRSCKLRRAGTRRWWRTARQYMGRADRSRSGLASVKITCSNSRMTATTERQACLLWAVPHSGSNN